MFNIYLAGAIEGVSFEEHNNWRKELKKRIENYCVCADCFNPNDHFVEGDFLSWNVSPESVMKFDLDRLRNSDLVIVNWNYPKSLGTMAEVAIAYDLKIPVLGIHEPSHTWQKAMTDVCFRDIDEVYDYVCLHYLKRFR